MAGLGAKDILRNVSALEQLIEEINFQRAKEMRQCLMSKDSDTGFVVVHGTTYWTDLFVRHFLFQTDRSTDADDLLFFIRKKHVRGSRYVPKYQTEVEVYRKDSRKLPIGDPDIDWEETVYLNLIIHQFDYTLTLAVCTRTSPKDLQILRRHSQKVYASPSRRRMDTKGEVEEITYPNVCFHVDNFDEVFCDMQVRDGEMVCVELVAADQSGSRQAVLFLGSIRYDALKRVYDARASLSSKVAQRMMLGLFNSSGNQRIEFVRMKGPQGKGHAEMAVTKPKGSGVETPTSEPGVSLTDLWDSDWDDEPEDRLLYRHQRRLSDPSANFNTFINSGWRARNAALAAGNSAGYDNASVGGAAGCGGSRSRSENEGLDSFADGLYEIESGDVRDGVCKCCVVCSSAPSSPPNGKVQQQDHNTAPRKCSNCQHYHTPFQDDTVQPVIIDEPNSITSNVGDKTGYKRVPTDDPDALQGTSRADVISEDESKNDPATLESPDEDSSLVIVAADECVAHLGDEVEEPTELEPLFEADLNEMRQSLPEVDVKSCISLKLNSTTEHELNEKSAGDRILKVRSYDGSEQSKHYDFKESFKAMSDSVLCRRATLPRALTKRPGTAVRMDPTEIAKDTSNKIKRKKKKKKKCVTGEKVFYTNLPVHNTEEVTVEFRASSPEEIGNEDSECVDTLTLNPLLKKNVVKQRRKVAIPYRITSDGTKVNFLSDIKLDDGAYNPLWSTRGFTQTFHFWKENRRAQSVPFNSYLTYVTLPWFTIITDILDHETDPILTF